MSSELRGKIDKEITLLKNFIIEHPEYFSTASQEKKVLDIGCGKRGSSLPQAFLQAFQHGDITYLDALFGVLEQLQVPREKKVWANACQMPFPDESFDFVCIDCFPIHKIVQAEPDDLQVIEINRPDYRIKVPRFKSPPKVEPTGWGGRAQYFAMKESYRILRKPGILTFYVATPTNVSQLVSPLEKIGFSGLELLLPETKYIDAKLYAAKKN